MNLIAIASQLAELNQKLESGAGLDQLVVVVSCDASAEQVEQAKQRTCDERGVKLDAVGQVVVVKTQEPIEERAA